MEYQEEATKEQEMLTAILPEAALAGVVELEAKLRANRSPQVVNIMPSPTTRSSPSLNSAVPTLMAGSRIWSLRKETAFARD